MRPFFYSVEGPNLYGESLENASWGVNATISQQFAESLAKTKRTKRIEKILQEDANFILKHGKFPNFSKFGKQRAYHFFEDTSLVRAVCVPGNACDLALDESALGYVGKFREKGEIIGDLNFMQHNVDSFTQAVFLEVLFRKWANHFEYLLSSP